MGAAARLWVRLATTLTKAFTGLLLRLRPFINQFIRFLVFDVSNIQGRPGERSLSLGGLERV
jgi:hypothetical protein